MKIPAQPKVILRSCRDYDPARIRAIIREGLEELGLRPSGRTLVKPNLVASGPLFPAQTPALTSSVAVQHRAMRAVAGAAPVPPLLGGEPDPAVLGQPFFVMGFVEGVIPSDRPRYSHAACLVDEATPAQRRRMVASGLETMGRIHALDWRAADLGWLDASRTGQPSTTTQLELYRRAIGYNAGSG